LNKASTLRLLGAVAALGALTVVGAGAGAASASPAAKSGATVIKMERDGKDLFFTGPATVAAGTELKIKNKTNPRQVGPHTFSLAHEKYLPEGNKQIKACAKKLKGICGAVVLWHDVDLQTGDIGENPVEVGKQGWDKEGSLKHKGDSWVATAKGESFSRPVTAKPGKVLHFFCAVHPNMQGAITVTEG
jgi:plastocyanin